MNRLINMQVLCPGSTIHLWKDIRLHIIRVVEDNKKIWKNIYPWQRVPLTARVAQLSWLDLHIQLNCKLATKFQIL